MASSPGSPGSVLYHDRPEQPRGWRFWQRERPVLETNVVLDWNALPPVQRIELMTNHDLAKREKQKLELLRSLLTYFHYASKETRPDVFRSEIERIKLAVAGDAGQMAHAAARRTHRRQPAWGNAENELGKHHSQRVVH